MAEIINLGMKWFLGKQLHSGGFGRIHLGHSEAGQEVVIKLVPKAPGAARELLFEDLDEVPNVVPILDRGEWLEYWVLVMPKADKSLRDYLEENVEHLSLEDTLQVLSDITHALSKIEGRVVHRDIKPDNILLIEGRWCLADFGISRYAEATTAPDTRKYAMTPPYAAPEQWRGERATSSTDVYSLGVIAYELLAGQLPFRGPDIHDYRRQHIEDVAEPISGVPLKLHSMIDECLYKGPEARPRPLNLLARLQESVRGGSAAGNRLQEANAIAVQRNAEVARRESVAKSEAERRAELCDAAGLSLARVISVLDRQILSNAPACERTGPLPRWSWSLNGAEMSVEPSRMVTPPSSNDSEGPPFEVVAYSTITLRIKPDRHQYEGRSHSLWFCDAQISGMFRWYETAFMFNPFIPQRGRLDPFTLNPGKEAYVALAPVMAEYQVAWPFTAIDQGNETEFGDLWIGRFADAAKGMLRHPERMPEREPNGSWRQS